MELVTEKTLRAKHAVNSAGILDHLNAFQPKVVSTIFVGLDTDDSDIDVICQFSHRESMIKILKSCYGHLNCFSCESHDDYVIGRFKHHQFLFEVYASPLAVSEQLAFKHYQIMERLSRLGGEAFRSLIREKRKSGFKTEPAIASLLKLEGDPYKSVLSLGLLSERELGDALRNISYPQC